MILGNLNDFFSLFPPFKKKKNDGGVFFFLKMYEAWANAPSLEHKSMSLKKT